MISRIFKLSAMRTLDSGVFFAALPRVRTGFAELRPRRRVTSTHFVKCLSQSHIAIGRIAPRRGNVSRLGRDARRFMRQAQIMSFQTEPSLQQQRVRP